MKILLLVGEWCSNCRFIEPHLKALCEKKWYELEVMNALEYKWEHLDKITSIPMMIISQDMVADTIYDYEQIINFYMRENDNGEKDSNWGE